MTAEPVAVIPQCEECKQVWLPDDGDRWQAYFDSDDELVFYVRIAPTGSLGSDAPNLRALAGRSPVQLHPHAADLVGAMSSAF
jgi:hypothetical protein